MRSRLSQSVFLVVGLAASALFLWLAARGVDLQLFWEALRNCDYLLLVPALAILAVAVAIRSWRWQLLFAPATRPPFGAVTRALLVGQLFNVILPMRAGEAARIVVLHQEAGTSRAESLGTAVVERVYDVLALLLLVLAGSAARRWPPPRCSRSSSWLRSSSTASAPGPCESCCGRSPTFPASSGPTPTRPPDGSSRASVRSIGRGGPPPRSCSASPRGSCWRCRTGSCSARSSWGSASTPAS